MNLREIIQGKFIFNMAKIQNMACFITNEY